MEVKLSDICFTYNKKNKNNILDHLFATFESGKVHVILGESGCGKTTLLRCILGLNKFQGKVYFGNDDVTYLSIKDRNTSYVSQSISLYPHLSAFENIAFPLRNTRADGSEIRERVDEVSQLLSIQECLSRKPRCLSIGQCQRVAIAKAIIRKPGLYLFDEPFSNLDLLIAMDLCHDLKRIMTRNNATVIFVTHNLQEALAIGDTFHYMEEGKFIFHGNEEELLQSNLSIVQIMKEVTK